jgi:hypothetical protein
MPSENYCDFTVFITDKSGKRGMVVEATSMDTEISFNSVSINDDIQGLKAKHRFER